MTETLLASSNYAEKSSGTIPAVPRRVKSLIFSLALNNLSFGYFLVYLTAFFPEIHIGSDVVGTIIGIQGAVLVLAGIPIGLLSDRRGRKMILVLGNAGFAPTILLVALARNVGLFYVAGAMGGLAEAAALSSWNAIIADQTDLTNRDSAFSLSFISSTVFTAIGFALPLGFPALQQALAISSYAVHNDFLIGLGIANAFSPILLWTLLRSYKEQVGSKAVTRRGNMRPFLKLTSLNGLIGLGAGFIIPLIPTWFFLKFNLPDTLTGPLLALSSITIGLSAVISPRLSRKYGLMNAIVMTAGSSTVFMFTLAFVPNAALAGTLYVCRAALMNTCAPLMDSFLMGIAPPENRGLASAVNAVVWRLPNSITTVAGGFILAAGKFDIPFYLATAFYAAAITLIYANFKNVKPTA